MKKTLILSVILAIAFSAAAQGIKLKDVPGNHWAASAVYDLIKLGITKGYPDGTFRGNKPITRYETAIFLSKLAKAIGGEDIKADIKELRAQVLELKKGGLGGLALKGNYEGSWKMGNVLARSGLERSGLGNYRLVLTAAKEMSEGAEIQINLDTMDYGYFDDGSAGKTGRGMLAGDLLDVQSKVKLDLSAWRLEQPLFLKLTYGPGAKQHAADPTQAFPSEVGVTYIRPDPGIEASTKLLGAEVSGGYYSVQGNTFEVSGKVNTGRFIGSVGYAFDQLKLGLTGDYMSKGLFSATEHSVNAKVNLAAALGEKAQISTTVGLGRASSRMMVAGKLALNDLWDTGTVVTIRAAKVGSQYISDAFATQQFDLAGYDFFNRPLENATVNIGGELVQLVSDRAKLIGKGDMRLGSDYKYEGAKARLTVEGGISYNLAPNVDLDAAYRVHQDKATNDTTDLAAVGLLYRF